MNAKAATVLAGLGSFILAGCTASVEEANQPVPPPWAELDRTAYNNQQVGLFVSRDPGWQAWLNAILLSDRANNALVDASRYNTPVIDIIQDVIAAQDAYRAAHSFNLSAFTVTSSCKNVNSETNGSVQLSNGLTVRYGFFLTQTKVFENGSSCVISTGLVDEIDSSRGLPVATANLNAPIEWDQSFSHYLAWHQPFLKLSTGTTLSLSDMVTLIEK
jgi:hypothetical protein